MSNAKYQWLYRQLCRFMSTNGLESEDMSPNRVASILWDWGQSVSSDFIIQLSDEL